MATAKCVAKHTVPQVPTRHFNCPNCGAKVGDWCIDLAAVGAHDDCTLLHVEDELYCSKCQYGTYGKQFAAHYAKQQGLTKCPHCRGTGVVKKEAEIAG